MKRDHKTRIRTLLFGLALLVSAPAAAQESPKGTMESPERDFAVSAGFSGEVDRKAYGDRSLAFMRLEGIAFNGEGQGFLHKAKIACRAADDSGIFAGYCEAADDQGDAVFIMMQWAGGSAAEGEALLTGGTGKYQGISGAAEYAVHFEPSTGAQAAKGMMTLKGRYTLAKGRASGAAPGPAPSR